MHDDVQWLDATITLPRGKYPRATISAYGPDKKRATKLVVGILRRAGQQVPLLDYFKAGRPLSEFLGDFPTVTRERAVTAVEQAKEALLARVDAAYQLGLIARARGQYADALRSLDAAIRHSPKYPLARLARRDVRQAVKASRVRKSAS